MAEIIAGFSVRHPDYHLLAGRVHTCLIHKGVDKSFSNVVAKLGARKVVSHVRGRSTHNIGSEKGDPPLLDATFVDAVKRNAEALDAALIHGFDFDMPL